MVSIQVLTHFASMQLMAGPVPAPQPTVGSTSGSTPKSPAPVTSTQLPVTPAPVTPAPVTPAPVTSPPTSVPTFSPSAGPTASPTIDRLTPLVSFLQLAVLQSLNETLPAYPEAPAYRAIDWILQESSNITYDEKLVQRFALVTLDFALGGNFTVVPSIASNGNFTGRLLQQGNFSWSQSDDECLWEGVVCANGSVTELWFGSRNLTGTIPDEIALLTNLTMIDLSNNYIGGTIPEKIYELSLLESLYFYHNQLTGTISKQISNLQNLQILFLNSNYISGRIPQSLRSGNIIRPLSKCFLTLFRCHSFVFNLIGTA